MPNDKVVLIIKPRMTEKPTQLYAKPKLAKIL